MWGLGWRCVARILRGACHHSRDVVTFARITTVLRISIVPTIAVSYILPLLNFAGLTPNNLVAVEETEGIERLLHLHFTLR